MRKETEGLLRVLLWYRLWTNKLYILKKKIIIMQIIGGQS